MFSGARIIVPARLDQHISMAGAAVHFGRISKGGGRAHPVLKYVGLSSVVVHLPHRIVETCRRRIGLPAELAILHVTWFNPNTNEILHKKPAKKAVGAVVRAVKQIQHGPGQYGSVLTDLCEEADETPF